jgi:hypothetical protein
VTVNFTKQQREKTKESKKSKGNLCDARTMCNPAVTSSGEEDTFKDNELKNGSNSARARAQGRYMALGHVKLQREGVQRYSQSERERAKQRERVH